MTLQRATSPGRKLLAISTLSISVRVGSCSLWQCFKLIQFEGPIKGGLPGIGLRRRPLTRKGIGR